jgi:hypothetical protein
MKKLDTRVEEGLVVLSKNTFVSLQRRNEK